MHWHSVQQVPTGMCYSPQLLPSAKIIISSYLRPTPQCSHYRNDETAHRGDVICLTPGQQDIKRWLLTSGNLVLLYSYQLVELGELAELAE